MQFALPAQWLWHSPDVHVVSQLALLLQLCEHLLPAQSCVQVLPLVQVAVQSPPAAQVSWHCADAEQPRTHLAPVQVAVQSLMPPQPLVHCLSSACSWQSSSQLLLSVQLPLPLMTMGELPPLPAVPALPPLALPAEPPPVLPAEPPLLPAVPALPACAAEPPAGVPPAPPPPFVPAPATGSPPDALVPACSELPPLALPACACSEPPFEEPAWFTASPPELTCELAALAPVALPLLPGRPVSLKSALPFELQAANRAEPTNNTLTSLAFADGRRMGEELLKLRPVGIGGRLGLRAGSSRTNGSGQVGKCALIPRVCSPVTSNSCLQNTTVG